MLQDYDVVLHSQYANTLNKSLNVLSRGGRLVSIAGPATPAFAVATGLPWYLKLVLGVLSRGARKKAGARGVGFDFLFMRANGRQLQQITALIEAGHIRPLIDRVYPFAETNAAWSHVAGGRTGGKVMIKAI